MTSYDPYKLAETHITEMAPAHQPHYQRTLLALQHLAPVTPDYATQPLLAGFNWGDCLAEVKTGQWYLVVFRSVRRDEADTAALIALDEHAHAEALASNGLLFYFKGHLDARRRCLSFCIWESRAQAREAARLPLHQAAADAVAQMYESYELERYILRKSGGRLLLDPVLPTDATPVCQRGVAR